MCVCVLSLNYMMILFGFPQNNSTKVRYVNAKWVLSIQGVSPDLCGKTDIYTRYTHKFCYPVHVQKEICDLRTKLSCSCDYVSEKERNYFSSLTLLDQYWLTSKSNSFNLVVRLYQWKCLIEKIRSLTKKDENMFHSTSGSMDHVFKYF